MAEEKDQTPWDDPNVKAALKDGRQPTDIWLIDCPNCGLAGYYNQGSHFICGGCGSGYACLCEEEEPPPDRAFLYLGDEYTLEDYASADVYGEGDLP